MCHWDLNEEMNQRRNSCPFSFDASFLKTILIFPPKDVCFVICFKLIFVVVLEIKLKASGMFSEHTNTQPHPAKFPHCEIRFGITNRKRNTN